MSATSLPTEPVTYQFQHATVSFCRAHSVATGRIMSRLYVQAIDQYRYQRELSVAFRHQPGDSSALYWECHAYRHPGRRYVQTVSEGVAKRFIARFLSLCDDYPSLLFNPTGDHATDTARPRHEGFVHLSEMLLDGAPLSVSLLD